MPSKKIQKKTTQKGAGREGKPKRGPSKNPWILHVKEYSKMHPGKKWSECLKEAKKTYKKKGDMEKEVFGRNFVKHVARFVDADGGTFKQGNAEQWLPKKPLKKSFSPKAKTPNPEIDWDSISSPQYVRNNGVPMTTTPLIHLKHSYVGPVTMSGPGKKDFLT